MQLPDLDPARSADALFDDISCYIESADKLVSAKDTVSLAGLDISIAALCQRIEALQPDEARNYTSELNTLMDKLDILQAKMIALQSEVAGAIKSLGSQKKASKAYNKAPTGMDEE